MSQTMTGNPHDGDFPVQLVLLFAEYFPHPALDLVAQERMAQLFPYSRTQLALAIFRRKYVEHPIAVYIGLSIFINLLKMFMGFHAILLRIGFFLRNLLFQNHCHLPWENAFLNNKGFLAWES